MGYYTSFSLDIKGEGLIYEKLIDDISNGLEFPGDFEMGKVEDVVDGVAGSCSWYEHAEDMIELSERYPNVLFILSGEGEQSGDIWKTYYRNGFAQTIKAKIVFDEPDLTKLPLIDVGDIEEEFKDIIEKKSKILQEKIDLQERLAELQKELDSVE